MRRVTRSLLLSITSGPCARAGCCTAPGTRTDMTRFSIALFAATACSADWMQFRGPNGSGVGDATRLPTEFGQEKNVLWKTAVPAGHSSPVIAGDLIFLTGAEGVSQVGAANNKVVDQSGKLYTLAIQRSSGKILWQREAPRARREPYQPTNSPASPSRVTDGEAVYVFFG